MKMILSHDECHHVFVLTVLQTNRMNFQKWNVRKDKEFDGVVKEFFFLLLAPLNCLQFMESFGIFFYFNAIKFNNLSLNVRPREMQLTENVIQ